MLQLHLTQNKTFISKQILSVFFSIKAYQIQSPLDLIYKNSHKSTPILSLLLLPPPPPPPPPLLLLLILLFQLQILQHYLYIQYQSQNILKIVVSVLVRCPKIQHNIVIVKHRNPLSLHHSFGAELIITGNEICMQSFFAIAHWIHTGGSIIIAIVHLTAGSLVSLVIHCTLQVFIQTGNKEGIH